MIRLTVYGKPVPQGSMKGFVPKGWKRPVLTSDNENLRPWRSEIVAAARKALDGKPPLAGAVLVRVQFFVPRPKSLAKRELYPINMRSGDIDKLERALLDALTTAGVWGDDAQVCQVAKVKAFAGGHLDPLGQAGVPRAEIEVVAQDLVAAVVAQPRDAQARRLARLEWVIAKMLSDHTWMPAADVLDPKRDEAWQESTLSPLRRAQPRLFDEGAGSVDRRA
jgi:Holliday junction resolvase RusA-like endonuclease